MDFFSSSEPHNCHTFRCRCRCFVFRLFLFFFSNFNFPKSYFCIFKLSIPVCVSQCECVHLFTRAVHLPLSQKDSTRAWKCTKNNQFIHYYVRQTDDSHSQLWPQEYCIWLSTPCALQHTNDAIHCTLCKRNLQQTHPAKSVNISLFFFLCARSEYSEKL